MAVELGVGYVSLAASARGLGASIEKELDGPATAAGSKAGSKTGKAFASGFTKLAAGVGAGVAIGLGKGALDAARESLLVSKQTDAVIKSTGAAAGLSAKQFGSLADSLARATGIDDELIQGTENVLATFKGIKGDVFKDATGAILDMSKALGQDMKSSAVQVGKALQDPLKGMALLTRQGVTFTDQQKAQVAAMIDVGDVAGAQKVILSELGQKFGGSAKAQATAADKLKVSMGNVQESIGKLLIPVLEKLAGFVDGVVTGFNNLSPGMKKVVAVVAGLVGGLVALVQVTKAFTAAQAALDIVLDANPIVLIGAAVVALVAGLILAYKHSETFRDVVDSTFRVVRTIVTDTLVVFEAIGTTVARVIGGAVDFLRNNWQNILLVLLTGPIGPAVKVIAGHFDEIVGFVRELPGRITGFAGDVLDGAKKIGGALFDGIVGVVTFLPRTLAEHVRGAIDGLIGIVNSFLGFLHDHLSFTLPTIHVPKLGDIGGQKIGFPDLQIPRLGAAELGKVGIDIAGGSAGILHLATGGSFGKFTPMIVGEEGPELVFPLAAGHVMDADRSRRWAATATLPDLPTTAPFAGRDIVLTSHAPFSSDPVEDLVRELETLQEVGRLKASHR